MTTDNEGRFRLEHPGLVIHISAKNFEPRTLVLQPSSRSDLRIILDPATSRLSVPTCGKPSRDKETIGWGKYGLQFEVSPRGVKIFGGVPDVDYVEYAIRPKRSKSFLELWFGPYAMSVEPDDQQFLDSIDFGERVVVSDDGQEIGVDSWGHGAKLGSWRQIFVAGEGARYQDASFEDAELFDGIVNSLCLVPYPSEAPRRLAGQAR